MLWIVLLVAGALEVVWVVAMKLSHGFTRPVPSLITVAALVASMALLSLALRELPAGTAYAVWVGIGAVGTAAVGMLALGEPVRPLRIAAIGLIVAGVVLLHLTERAGRAG